MSGKQSRSSTKSGKERQENSNIKEIMLQTEIRMLTTTLSDVKIKVDKLVKEQANLDTYLKSWEGKKRTYEGDEIMSKIVIPNVFEGVCAETIKNDIEKSIGDMNQIYNGTKTLYNNLASQIAMLNNLISQINAQINSLNYQLKML